MRKLQEFSLSVFHLFEQYLWYICVCCQNKFFSVFVSPFKVHKILNWRASEVRGKFGRFLSICAFCESSSDEIN